MNEKFKKIVNDVTSFHIKEFLEDVDDFLEDIGDLDEKQIYNKSIDSDYDEYGEWKNEKRYNDFLNFLIELNKEEGVIFSDNYNEENSKYSSEEFELMLNALEDSVHDYAKNNFIDTEFNVDDEEECFYTQSSIVLKYKDNFYQIGVISAKTSCIMFNKIDNFTPTEQNHVDYNLMISNSRNSHKKANIKNLIKKDLDDIKDRVIASDVNEKIFIEALKDYLKEYRQKSLDKN